MSLDYKKVFEEAKVQAYPALRLLSAALCLFEEDWNSIRKPELIRKYGTEMYDIMTYYGVPNKTPKKVKDEIGFGDVVSSYKGAIRRAYIEGLQMRKSFGGSETFCPYETDQPHKRAAWMDGFHDRPLAVLGAL